MNPSRSGTAKRVRRSVSREALTWIAGLVLLPHRLRVPLLRAAGIDVHRSAHLRAGVRIVGGADVVLERGVFVNEFSYFDASATITVREFAQIANHVRLITSTHMIDTAGARVAGDLQVAPIVIGAGSWVGAGATILPGVRVGDHSILAAGAVATRDLEDYCVYAGVPAKLVRRLQASRRE
jgi:acetyltransferase-like isoleucine patch superfamily enzyme